MGRHPGRRINVTAKYEFQRARPEQFACFECGGLTAIDENNRTMPHATAAAACGAVGRRVMVRWPQEFYRCSVCHVPGLVTEPGTIPPHAFADEPCLGAGLDAIRWRTVVPRDGVAAGQPKATISEASGEAHRGDNSKRTGRGSRQGVDRESVLKPSPSRQLRGVSRRLADQPAPDPSNASRRRASTDRARLERQAEDERDAAFREQVQNRKRKGGARKNPIRNGSYIRVVSGGLPGSARRH